MLPDFALKAPQAERQLVLIFEAKPAASPFRGNLLALAFVGVIHLRPVLCLELEGQGGSEQFQDLVVNVVVFADVKKL